jgi:hypothetical protein
MRHTSNQELTVADTTLGITELAADCGVRKAQCDFADVDFAGVDPGCTSGDMNVGRLERDLKNASDYARRGNGRIVELNCGLHWLTFWR